MEALFILLIFSLLLGGGFLAAFFWAQRSGQFDDTETPALRMLFDEADAKREKTPTRNTSPLDTSLNKGDHHGS
jgi:cbb3-type cytochrome oxidase maturation protein